MSELLQRLDPTSYSFLARVRPVLFVSIPSALAVWTWIGGELEGAGWLLSLAIAAGLPYVLGEKAADRGRSEERELWDSWGGAPTTRLLRHSNDSLNPHTQQRIHRSLAAACPGLEIPTPAEEEADPPAADAVYASCVDRIRVLAREDSMIVKTNISYGFRRNLWAIRRWGIGFSLLGAFAGLAHVILHGFTMPALVTFSASTLLLLFLLAVVTRAWIHEAANVYAQRLLEWLEHQPVEKFLSAS